ncbi:hypothetical protein BTVI_118536 [Pitangus sulphuratus]|nr:hypothetical protein BTVI_118536 [Pitangus sulphuratus]
MAVPAWAVQKERQSPPLSLALPPGCPWIYCLLDGPCRHMSHLVSSLWPCPLDELQIHLTALSQVLSPVHSTVAPDSRSWTVPGPVLHFPSQGLSVNPVPQALLTMFKHIQHGESMANTGITLRTQLTLP